MDPTYKNVGLKGKFSKKPQTKQMLIKSLNLSKELYVIFPRCEQLKLIKVGRPS